MNCYTCLVETGDTTQAACAVCKECGAGVCHTHAVDVTHTTPAGSMSMITAPRSRLLCQRCYRALFPASSSPQAKGYVKGYSESEPSTLWHWWQRLWHRQPAPASNTTLPSPEEAISAVEQFLKEQVTPNSNQNSNPSSNSNSGSSAQKLRDIEWPD
jgi:hypothetical protein